jgi:hypothetical protein
MVVLAPRAHGFVMLGTDDFWCQRAARRRHELRTALAAQAEARRSRVSAPRRAMRPSTSFRTAECESGARSTPFRQ